MTEVEEVAEKLVEGYRLHCQVRYAAGKMAGTLDQYILNRLSENESYNYIDEVKAAAKKLPHA